MAEEKFCERCGSKLSLSEAEIAARRKTIRARFCSKKCANSGKPIGLKTRYRRLGSRRLVGDREEHRAVWEAANGPVLPGYEVHHKNHDRLDNRLENLELLTVKDHHAHHARVRREKAGRT